MANPLLVVLALALAASASGGVAFVALEDHSSANVLTIEGTVVRAELNPHWNVSTDIQIRTTNNTTYNVDLGPPWWWAQQKYPTIHVNDTVKVTGVGDDENDGNATAGLTAFTISVNGGSTITLRSGGMPAWAEQRSSEHDDAENETDD